MRFYEETSCSNLAFTNTGIILRNRKNYQKCGNP